VKRPEETSAGQKITVEAIKRAVAKGPDAKVGAVIWDSAVTGFHARVWPSGNSTFAYYYRVNGRGRWKKIGKLGQPWTVESARREAKRLQGMVAVDLDPAEEREKAAAERAASETLAALAERWLERVDHLVTVDQRSPATVREYRRHVELHIVPALGPVAAAAVTPATVQKLHYSLRSRPVEANRVLSSLSAMLTWARIEPNPTRHVERYEEGRRTRHLTDAELAALGKALRDAEAEAPVVTGFLRMLLLTGARPGELMPLKWEQIDRDAGFLRIAKTKAGRADPRAQSGIVITPPVAEVLARLEQTRSDQNPYVFPSRRRGSHLAEYTQAWREALKRAGIAVKTRTTATGRVLTDLPVYVARHTTGTTAAPCCR